MNKKLLPVFVVLVLVLLGVGGYFVLFSKKSEPAPQEQTTEESSVKQLTPEDLGLTLIPINKNQDIEMEMTKLDGVASIDYEVSYDALENGETVPRGVIGSAEIEGDTLTREIKLGTCSRNICKYDKGVTEVKFLIRVNYSDGSVGEVEDSVSLEE